MVLHLDLLRLHLGAAPPRRAAVERRRLHAHLQGLGRSAALLRSSIWTATCSCTPGARAPGPARAPATLRWRRSRLPRARCHPRGGLELRAVRLGWLGEVACGRRADARAEAVDGRFAWQTLAPTYSRGEPAAGVLLLQALLRGGDLLVLALQYRGLLCVLALEARQLGGRALLLRCSALNSRSRATRLRSVRLRLLALAPVEGELLRFDRSISPSSCLTRRSDAAAR